MMQVTFHRLAAVEYQQAHAWYSRQGVDVAARFVEAVNLAIERVRADPTSQPIEPPSFFWARVRRFPYRLIYDFTLPGDVFMIAVAHSSRRPRYWRRRS